MLLPRWFSANAKKKKTSAPPRVRWAQRSLPTSRVVFLAGLWPQRKRDHRAPMSRGGANEVTGVGRSSGFRINLRPRLLLALLSENGIERQSSPVTAAGPRRICTVFPLVSLPTAGDRHQKYTIVNLRVLDSLWPKASRCGWPLSRRFLTPAGITRYFETTGLITTASPCATHLPAPDRLCDKWMIALAPRRAAWALSARIASLGVR